MNKASVPPQWRETLDRLSQGERLLWAGRPQPPRARRLRYPLPLLPAVAGILLFPALLVAAAKLTGESAPWVSPLSAWGAAAYFLANAAVILYARMRFSRTLYAVTDRRLWLIRFPAGARRPIVRAAEPAARMRISWRWYADGFSTFRISRDRIENGGKKRTHLLEFRDISDGRAVKSLLVENFISKEMPPYAFPAPPAARVVTWAASQGRDRIDTSDLPA